MRFGNPCRPIHIRKARGFTLIELIVVMAIIGLMLTLALPRYHHSVDRSREAVLIENIKTLRQTIDRFYGDTGRYPESLEELVARKYLRAVPLDPITERRDTWVVLAPGDESKGNVFDVKSSAPGTTSDGVAFGDL